MSTSPNDSPIKFEQSISTSDATESISFTNSMTQPMASPLPINTNSTSTTTSSASTTTNDNVVGTTESILHLRLSLSPNGIQLLPPYLERPLRLSNESPEYKINDFQQLLTVLSGLSIPIQSVSSPANPLAPDSLSSFSMNQVNPSTSQSSAPTSSSYQPPTSSSPPPHSRSYSHSRARTHSLDPNPSSNQIPSSSSSSSSFSNERRSRRTSLSPSDVHRSSRAEKRYRSISPHRNGKSERSLYKEDSKLNNKDFDDVSVTFMNLPFHAKKEEIHSFFESCGPMKQCQFVLNNNRSFRGIAHVIYETPEGAKKALKLHNTEFRGRDVSVLYTDYSLLARNQFPVSRDLLDDSPPSSPSSRNKRSKRDHYSSSVTKIQPLDRKTYTVLLENLPLGLSLDQIHDEASKNGNVVRVDWGNRGKTSAYLDYSKLDSAKSAIKRLDRRTVNNTVMRASLFEPHSSSSPIPTLEKKQPFLLKISNLPENITETELQEFLKDVGNIDKVRISKSKRAAYLEVQQDEVASAILAKNEQMLMDSTLKVAPYHEKDR